MHEHLYAEMNEWLYFCIYNLDYFFALLIDGVKTDGHYIMPCHKYHE